MMSIDYFCYILLYRAGSTIHEQAPATFLASFLLLTKAFQPLSRPLTGLLAEPQRSLGSSGLRLGQQPTRTQTATLLSTPSAH